MGPELISGRCGYDGKKVDVWASGVLLFVLLLGMFPFEMEDENYVNTAGLYSIWIQQIRTSWQENPHNSPGVSRLSPECRCARAHAHALPRTPVFVMPDAACGPQLEPFCCLGLF